LDRTTARIPNLYTERAPPIEPHGPTEKENEHEREQTPSTKKASEQESKHNNINDTRRHSPVAGRASNHSSQHRRDSIFKDRNNQSGIVRAQRRTGRPIDSPPSKDFIPVETSWRLLNSPTSQPLERLVGNCGSGFGPKYRLRPFAYENSDVQVPHDTANGIHGSDRRPGLSRKPRN
jgi:hypothetical protein